MELIERILKAEREADRILREADSEVRKIERNAQSNAEVLLSLARRKRGPVPKEDPAVDSACLDQAAEDAQAERSVAEERQEQARSVVLSRILATVIGEQEL